MNWPQRSRIAFALAVLVWWLCPPLAFAQVRTPAQRLQDAVQLIETNGDLRGAIPVLIEISNGQDKAIAARACLLLGQTYERLGEDRASVVYRRIERDFADQPAAVAEARAALRRLAASADARGRDGPEAAQIWALPLVLVGPPSRDGRWVPVIDSATGNLTLRNTQTDETIQVARLGARPGGHTPPALAALSPDGSQLAYAASGAPAAQPGRIELRAFAVRSAATRIVLARESTGIEVAGWMADGHQVLAVVRLQDGAAELCVVTLDSGGSRTIARLPDSPASVALSPDGRTVAYDVPQSPGSPAHDLAARDVATGVERVVMAHRADDRFPVWTPDGQSLVFVSDRTGAAALWQFAVATGSASDEASLMFPNVGRIRPFGISAAGDLYFSQLIGLPDAGGWEVWMLKHTPWARGPDRRR